MSNYCTTPTEISGTVGTTIPSFEQLNKVNEGTVVNTLSKLILTAALVITSGTGGYAGVSDNSRYTEILNASKKAAVVELVGESLAENKPESSAQQSVRLQHDFGFKTAQWAAVLKVERKTLYNWKNNPSTTIQQRTLDRLDTLNSFRLEVDDQHARYISKLSFGRYADEQLREALVSNTLSFERLSDEYYRLYSKIDGKYKRDKHRNKLA